MSPFNLLKIHLSKNKWQLSFKKRNIEDCWKVYVFESKDLLIDFIKENLITLEDDNYVTK